MKRIYILGLAVLMVFSLVIPCFAAEVAETTITPRYTYIGVNKVGLTINETTGIAQCSSYCYTDGTYTVEVVCKLQKYAGGFYSTVKTWSSSGTSYASVHKSWAVYSGYTYRLYAIFYVYDSAGKLLESATSSASYNYPKN